jgi:hypothetical protein
LPARTRFVLDLLMDRPGGRLDADWIATQLSARDGGGAGRPGRRSVPASLSSVSRPHARSGRRLPFYWWRRQDGGASWYAMKPAVARLFRQARQNAGDAGAGAARAGIVTQPAGNGRGRIFMSYRRDETAYPAAWLFDRLASQFGRHQVFKDVDSIEPGDDFAEVITTAVESCDVLLALIGRHWLTIADQDGLPRLDDPDDFIRLEIEAALTRNVRVIPILVDGARMPGAEKLPPSLAGLARRQALELSPVSFDADIQRLLRVLERGIAGAEEQHSREAGRVLDVSSFGAASTNPSGHVVALPQPVPGRDHIVEPAAVDNSDDSVASSSKFTPYTNENPGDEDAYERATWAAIEECKHLGRRYDPAIWIGMVRRSGAVEAAKHLLVSGDIQYGFRRLIDEGRPDLTVEWSVLLPRWRQLFSDQYREAAQWRLQQAGVKPPQDDT